MVHWFTACSPHCDWIKSWVRDWPHMSDHESTSHENEPVIAFVETSKDSNVFYFITIRAKKNDISTHAISFKICWRTIPFTLKLQVLISNVGFTECHLHHPQFITIFMGDWKIKEPSPNIYIYICIYVYIIGFPTLFQWSNYPFIIHYC